MRVLAWLHLVRQPAVLGFVLPMIAFLVVHLFNADILAHAINKPAFSAGISVYFLTLVAFVALGRRDNAWSGPTQIASSLAMAAATVFLLLAWLSFRSAASSLGCLPTSTVPATRGSHECNLQFECMSGDNARSDRDPPAGDPLSPINALAAVLAVVLALLTIVAQKSASEARSEAEKASQLINDAWNIRLTNQFVRFALASQRFREQSSIDMYQKENYGRENMEGMEALLHGWSSFEGRLASFLADLLHSVDNNQLPSMRQRIGSISALVDSLVDSCNRIDVSCANELRRERERDLIRPLRNLLEDTVRILSDRGSFYSSNLRDHELIDLLRDLISVLDTLSY